MQHLDTFHLRDRETSVGKNVDLTGGRGRGETDEDDTGRRPEGSWVWMGVEA